MREKRTGSRDGQAQGQLVARPEGQLGRGRLCLLPGPHDPRESWGPGCSKGIEVVHRTNKGPLGLSMAGERRPRTRLSPEPRCSLEHPGPIKAICLWSLGPWVFNVLVQAKWPPGPQPAWCPGPSCLSEVSGNKEGLLWAQDGKRMNRDHPLWLLSEALPRIWFQFSQDSHRLKKKQPVIQQ